MERLGRLALIYIILFAGQVMHPADSSDAAIVGSGCSVSNLGYMMDLAKEYEKRTGVKVLVRGGGSVGGLDDLRNGRVDFAASCRPGMAGDPEDIEFVQVAWDALVSIVHPSNPVSDISLKEMRQIYAGSINNWKTLGGKDTPIKVFVSRPGKGLSGVESSTRRLILDGKEPVETANATFVASTGVVEEMVERTPDGFATTGFSSARKRNVKMLNVKMLTVGGVYPTKANISTDKYPFRRPLYLVIPSKPKAEVKKFIEFVLSREGQRIISSLGVVALNDVK